MTHTVGLIHAVIPAMPPMRDAFARLLPDVRVLNLLDEALLKEAERLGGIGPSLVRRMTGLVALHEAAGAELVLFTCNAYSPYADQVQAQAGIPVLTIDQALLDKALAAGKRLGVLATVAAGLEQQSKSIDSAAAAAGVKLTSLKPAGRRAVVAFEELSFEVGAQGRYLALCQWLLGFEQRIGRSATVSEFTMKSSDEGRQVMLTLRLALYRPLPNGASAP